MSAGIGTSGFKVTEVGKVYVKIVSSLSDQSYTGMLVTYIGKITHNFAGFGVYLRCFEPSQPLWNISGLGRLS